MGGRLNQLRIGKSEDLEWLGGCDQLEFIDAESFFSRLGGERHVVVHPVDVHVLQTPLHVEHVVLEPGDGIGRLERHLGMVDEVERGGQGGFEVETLHRLLRSFGPIRDQHG